MHLDSGNGGGGLNNADGKLMGIVNSKFVDEGVENIGYAIPSNVVKSIADNIIDYCFGTETERVQRAMLGISVTTSDSKAVYDSSTGMISIKETVSVYEVSEGSIVKGILNECDTFVSSTLNENVTEINRQYDIIDMMLDVRAGDTVNFNIIRDGKNINVSITITEDCLTEY